jgi:hypothetical protein
MDEETIVYMALTGMIVFMAIFTSGSAGPLAAGVIIMAVFAAITILIINYADFLIFPVFTMIIGASIVPMKNYRIPKSQNCIIKEVNGIYYAIGYLTANIYNYVFSAESINDEENAQIAAAPDKWEKIVMNIKFPFKYKALVAAEELQKYREELEAKRGSLEYQLSKEMSGGNPSQMAIDDMQRRKSVLQARIDRLSGGERPVNSIMYIETTAFGVSEKAATDTLDEQISQIEATFNAMDLSIIRVTGRELYILLKFNYTVPTAVEEMTKMFHQQS